ncbi:hypothetical protein ABZ403_07575 [Micromonospora zamorensis]|uniref:hypothetical protein n=1 Tax=Micromonospora zamorensis TaxID=709883 RepID=UPI0033C58D11
MVAGQGLQDFVTPHELTDDEMTATIADFTDAARNAIDPDPATFYGGDARGYTDYPALDGSMSTVV